MHNLKAHMEPHRLERYSFVWSQLRLLIASLALFLGGIPPVVYFFRPSSGLVGLLTLCWIISGIASAYLLYRWVKAGKHLFGAKHQKDLVAFMVSVVSGLNLGLTGLTGRNVGMSISSNRVIFIAVGILYILAFIHLQKRYRQHGNKLF
jgi:hypothetical protein